VDHGIRTELCAIQGKRDGRLTTEGSCRVKGSPPILNVILLDELEETSFVTRSLLGNIGGIHMPVPRIKASSRERRMKRVAPSARKRVNLPAALAMKANNIIERYSLEEREQIVEILRLLSAKPQQFRFQFLGVADAGPTVQYEASIWATDQPTAVRIASDAPLHPEATGIRVVDHKGCTVFERQNSELCGVQAL
jgi:hypothetical protein